MMIAIGAKRDTGSNNASNGANDGDVGEGVARSWVGRMLACTKELTIN